MLKTYFYLKRIILLIILMPLFGALFFYVMMLIYQVISPLVDFNEQYESMFSLFPLFSLKSFLVVLFLFFYFWIVPSILNAVCIEFLAKKYYKTSYKYYLLCCFFCIQTFMLPYIHGEWGDPGPIYLFSDRYWYLINNIVYDFGELLFLLGALTGVALARVLSFKCFYPTIPK